MQPAPARAGRTPATGTAAAWRRNRRSGNNLANLEDSCPPEHRHKLHLFLDYAGVEAGGEVPDPYYGNLAGFERVLALCEAGARGVLDRVAPSAR